MALRYNVRQKRRKIRRDLTPLENYLLDDIQEGTIDSWETSSEFNLQDLAEGLGTQVNRIYAMLKDLHEKGIITREPTRYAGLEKIGLSTKYFGQILSDYQQKIEDRKHLSLVPNRTDQVPNGTKEDTKRYSASPKRDKVDLQTNEIIQESPPSDLIDNLNSSRCDSGPVPPAEIPYISEAFMKEYRAANTKLSINEYSMKKYGRRAI